MYQGHALYQTGSDLGQKINSLSGFTTANISQVKVTGSNAISIANFTGIGGTVVSYVDGYVTVSGGGGGGDVTSAQLTETGQTLYNYINGLSGIVNTDIVNLINSGQTLYNLITGGSGQGVTDYATKIQLTNTGATLDGRINSLSGFVGNVSGGLEARITATGASVVTHANGIGTIISGNVQNTGSNLFVTLTGMSGQGVTDYATKTLLTTSGQTLYNLITNSSGAFDIKIGSTGSTLNGYIAGLSGVVNADITNLTASGQRLFQLASGTSGNLSITGVTIIGLIAGLSGVVNNDITNLTTSGQTLYNYTTQLSGEFNTKIRTTGSNLYVTMTGMSGQFNTNLGATGSTLFNRDATISGIIVAQIQASSAGVSSLNAMSGVLNLSATGVGIGITTGGSNQAIYISGSRSIPEKYTINQTYDGMTMPKVFGETINFGDAVFFKNDGKAWKASASGTGFAPVFGLCVSTGGANATGTILLFGTIRNDTWGWSSTGGAIYLASGAAGSMTQTQIPAATDNVVQILGVAHPDSGTMFFRPSPDYLTRV